MHLFLFRESNYTILAEGLDQYQSAFRDAATIFTVFASCLLAASLICSSVLWLLSDVTVGLFTGLHIKSRMETNSASGKRTRIFISAESCVQK